MDLELVCRGAWESCERRIAGRSVGLPNERECACAGEELAGGKNCNIRVLLLARAAWTFFSFSSAIRLRLRSLHFFDPVWEAMLEAGWAGKAAPHSGHSY